VKRALLLATGVFATSAHAGQGPPPPLCPVRTPISGSVAAASRPEARCPGARITGQVFLGEEDQKGNGSFTLTLFGEGLRGEGDLWESPVDLPVEGGTGRFEWSVVSPGYDPARGVVTLREGETATIGAVRLVRGSASLEGLVSTPDRRPVAGAEVAFSGAIRPAAGGDENRAKTDETGRFRFEGLAAGKGFVHLPADDLPAMAAVPVEISPGGRHWIELSPAVGSFLLRVHGKWDRPFRLSLEDPDLHVAASWKFEPPEWSEEEGWSCGGVGIG
jgi:hypothetical protein